MKYFIWMVMISFLLGGCVGQEKKIPIEEIDMVGIMAFDYVDDHIKKMTVAIPQYSQDAKEDTKLFSVEAELISKGIMKIESMSDRKIVLNQLRVVLISEELARKGYALEIIEHIYRYSEVGNKAFVAIVKDEAASLIEEQYSDEPNVNFYLHDLLLPSLNTAFNPNTNIHDFIYAVTNTTEDAVVPYLQLKEGKIEISHIALFKEEVLVDLVSPDDAVFIQALLGEKSLAPIFLDLENKKKIMLELVQNSRKVKSNKDNENPELFIQLQIKGILTEYNTKDMEQLDTWNHIGKLEREVEKELAKKISQIVEDLAKEGIDPIGVSEQFRKSTRGKWTREMSLDILSKVQVHVEVKTIIVSTGTLR